MNFRIVTGFAIAVLAATLTSCQQSPKGRQTKPGAPGDSTAAQPLKPAESGYAAVNGLKMYYEIYGSGKPVVLLHGSFMSIPLNWSHIIPMLAKDRKVIVAEMQGHGGASFRSFPQ